MLILVVARTGKSAAPPGQNLLNSTSVHGLRCASPVATVLGPAGACSRSMLVASRCLRLLRGEGGSRMVDFCRIAGAIATAMVGGIVVAFPPAGAGVFAKGDCVFADVASGGQRLVGQDGQGEGAGHLVEMPVK